MGTPKDQAASDGAAATVVLLRDGELGLEVLLAERPHDRGSFRGAWVFPGGAVDEADAAGEPVDGLGAARRAAVRETLEEVGLEVDADELVPFSHWVPPRGAQKRLVTTFFAVRVPDGEIRPAADEVVSVAWLRPAEALERHAAGSLTLWPPTWVTLHGLAAEASVDAALAALAAGEIRPYVSRFNGDRSTLYWQEDEEYEEYEEYEEEEGSRYAPSSLLDRREGSVLDLREGANARHRLVMTSLPWVYLDSF